MGIGNWFTGAVATWWTLHFLHHSISLSEALIIESLVQLARAVVFLIPGGIGAQESVLVLVCEIITGSPASGLATAVVRRAREAVWIAVGVLIGYKLLFIQDTLDATKIR